MFRLQDGDRTGAVAWDRYPRVGITTWSDYMTLHGYFSEAKGQFQKLSR